jgi:PAT family beta-lactamase induction signal transducer AmpG
VTVHAPIVPGSPRVRTPHPVAYTILMVPFGAVSGYVTVAMAFLATKSGLSVQQGATLAAISLLPQTWKFFWSPVVDLTLTRKWWYIISAVLSAAGIVAMSGIPLDPAHLAQVQIAIFLASLATTLTGMSLESLVAHSTPREQQGRVGGWMQAGNLGGNGIGGGLGLTMATSLPAPWMSGAVLGAAFLAGCIVLVFVHEPKRIAAATGDVGDRIGVAVWDLSRDIWKTIVSRRAFVCVLLCVLPIGTGAATNVLSESTVAGAWGVDEKTVAFVNGWLNGIISAAGCLIGGEICARMSSRKAYVLFGLLMAAVAAAMAVAPHTPWAFKTFILAYAFVTGLSYAAYTGFVLEAIGKGAAATKYNAFASLANTPIAYMTLVLAKAFTKWNATGMLLTEAGAGVAGVLLLIGAVLAVNGIAKGLVAWGYIRPKSPLACPGCGYDLGGLAAGSACPECGNGASST